MKKTTTEVTSCHDCPFKNYSYDDFSLGNPESHACIPLRNNWIYKIVEGNQPTTANYFIDFYKNGNVKSRNKKTLDNCPLLEQDINVSLKQGL